MDKGKARSRAARERLLDPRRAVPELAGLNEQRGAAVRPLKGQTLGLAAREADLAENAMQVVGTLRLGVLDFVRELQDARGCAG